VERKIIAKYRILVLKEERRIETTQQESSRLKTSKNDKILLV